MKKLTIIILIALVSTAVFIPLPARTDLEPVEEIPVVFTGELLPQEEVQFTGLMQPENGVQSEAIVQPSGQLSSEIISEISSGVSFVSLPHLIISEVFFDGSDERFEISNVGSGTFEGTLTIKGVKSSDLHLGFVTLLSGSIFVRGDTMTQIVDKTVIKGNSLGLSISDSAALSLQLNSGDQVLDMIQLSASEVSSLPNNFGFERIRSGQSLATVPSSTGRIQNISGSRIANPGYVFSHIPPVQAAPPVIISTGTQPPVVDSGAQSSTGFIDDYISFSEIHPGSDALPEYVELYFARPFHGTLSIKGLGSSSAAKSFTTQALTGQHLVITDSTSGFISTYGLVVLDSISLTDGGESLVVHDLSGNIYDEAIYTGSYSTHSRYFDTGTMFSISNFMSPGYSEKLFQYIPLSNSISNAATTNSESHDTYYQSLYKKRKERYYELKDQVGAFDISVNTAGMAYRKTSSTSEVELVDGTEEFNDKTPLAMDSELRIHTLLADAQGKDDGNEQVTILLLSGSAADLSQFFIHAGTKKTYLTGMLIYTGDHHTLKGNFGFTNKPLCITLEKSDVVYDTFCYGQPKAGIRTTTTGDISKSPDLSGVVSFDRMKKLTLELFTGQACALFGDVSFDCLSLSGVGDEKIKTKYEKKLASLQLKYDKKQRQYTGSQERYKTMKTTLDAKRRKYYQQLKTVRATYKGQIATYKLESKIRKNYGQLLQKDLKDNRQVVRNNSHISFIQSLLDQNIAALKSDGTGAMLTLDGQTFAVGDLRKQLAFVTDLGVIVDNLIQRGLHVVMPPLALEWDKRLTIWYKEDE